MSTGAEATGRQQSSKTCVTCRARKVRCDGRRDVCANCERLGFACSYDEQAFLDSARQQDPAFNPLAPFPPRRRVKQACLNCHSRKAKCGGQLPRCDRCKAQGVECVYGPSKRSRPGTGGYNNAELGSESGIGTAHGSTGSRTPRQRRSLSLDKLDSTFTSPSSTTGGGAEDNRFLSDGRLQALTARTFESFFQHVHHIPMFSFLHRASLMQRHNADMVDRPLLLAMVGITSLFTDMGPGMRVYGARCIDEAEKMIMESLDRPSTLRLQALVFVIKHRHLSRRFSHAFMLYATASRFATALRLNHENPSLCFLAQESRRRLMWAIFMLDMWVAGGNGDFSLWSSPAFITIQLPCNERKFEYDLPETTEPLLPSRVGPDDVLPPLPDDIGFLALYIRIHWIRMRILQFTMKAIKDASPAAMATLPGRCADLQEELESFAARLPASFRWSDTNVRLRAYSPRLYVYVMTHVWWQQCHCDLYRIGLVGLREALPRDAIARLDPRFVVLCRQQCYGHARAIADIFALVLALDNGIPISDVDLPLCAYQCARMLYYIQQTSSRDISVSGESVQEMAKGCLRVVQQSVAGDASLAIQADLERLIAQGTTLSRANNGTPAAVSAPPTSPLLSRNGLINPSALADQDDTIAIRSNIGSPETQNQPGIAFVDGLPGPRRPSAVVLQIAQPTVDAMDTTEPGQMIAESTGVAPTNASDAFEGALEGLDFGAETLGMDSLAWFTNYDLDGVVPEQDQMLL
jgi:hypothetical protein